MTRWAYLRNVPGTTGSNETEDVMSNPWKAEAISRAARYSEDAYTGSVEAELIEGEYSRHPDNDGPCERENCPGEFWWKATIGASKCTVCGGLLWAGKFLG